MGLFDNPPVASIAIGQDNRFDPLETAGRAMIGDYDHCKHMPRLPNR